MTTDYRLSFGALLKHYRRAAELSQEQLGERAGYSAVYIRKLEGGARRPTSSTVELLAHALGITGDELVALQEAARRLTESHALILNAPPVEPDHAVRTADVQTFLIADIRGYTRFTHEHGDEAAARLTTTFASVARETVRDGGGEVIELRGDEVLAVFASARGALRTALALRDRCSEIAERDPSLPLHVGIGMDAGEAVQVDGGFRGGALNLAARLGSLARAGEVFASETVVGLARKVEGIAYRERGRVQLKGYAEPVSVVQALPEHELELLSRPETFDAVLAAGSEEGSIVELLTRGLEDAGVKVWTSGRDSMSLATALHLTGCALVLVGPAGLDAGLRGELAEALDPLSEEWRPRVFLVLLPAAPDPFDAAVLPAFLSTRVWIDLRNHRVDAPEVTAQLVRTIEGGTSPADRPTRTRTDECPYRGLEAFDEGSAEFYFGREADVQRLIERLKSTSSLAILGPSGSGKSSLVRAGLLSSLRRGALPGAENWTVRVLTPGPHPLTALSAQLLRLYPRETMQATLDEMARDSRTLHLATTLALADRSPDDRIVWVLDQFEEIFTLCDDEAERRQFLANVLHAVSVPDSRTVGLLTMRADFYHRCAQYPELAARLAADQYLVGALDRERLRQVIEEPAWRVGLEFEQGLVERMLEDVLHQPGALPLLEYALRELWERREGHILTLDAYRESGGVQGAIAQRAETTFARFTPEEQTITRRMLLRLTQAGEGTADTRRRVAMTELATMGAFPGVVERVVNALVDARLLTTGQDDQGAERHVEVAHEALIRGWPRLRQLIDEDRAGLRTHRRLTEAAQEWDRIGRDAGSLYRGTPLAIAFEWAQRNSDALNQLERTYLAASVRAQEEEQRAARRRMWGLIGGLVAVLVIISAAALFAVTQEQQALRDRDAAVSAQVAQEATALLPTDRTLAILLSVEAVHISRTAAAVAALRDSLAQYPTYRRLTGHENAVASAWYSPDDRLIATASADGRARVWDARSGRLVRTLDPHAGALDDARFSPDGREIVTAGADGLVRIWSATTGSMIRVLRGHRGPVQTAVFSPDGRRILTAGQDRTARLWDAHSGRLVRTFRGHTYAVNAAAFSPDGARIVTASDDGTARVWDGLSGRELWALPGNPDIQISDAAFSPDGSTVLILDSGGVARLVDAQSGRRSVSSFRAPSSLGLTGGGFSPDGRWIATGERDARVRVWDVKTGTGLIVLGNHSGVVNTAAFSPDERWLVSASNDGTALIRSCDVCGSVEDLLALAHRRVHRSLTAAERQEYLSLS